MPGSVGHSESVTTCEVQFQRLRGHNARNDVKRSRFGPGMQCVLTWIAEYGSRHATAKVDAKLMARFRARVAIALHRGLMHAYLDRAQQVAKREHQVTGRTPVDALVLRWQGLGRAC